MHTGHQTYVAFVEQTPVGYGWMATQQASIGELGLQFALPETDRYLWDFATLPEWQGYGIYPRLLQHILMQQSSTVERIWIIMHRKRHRRGNDQTVCCHRPALRSGRWRSRLALS